MQPRCKHWAPRKHNETTDQWLEKAMAIMAGIHNSGVFRSLYTMYHLIHIMSTNKWLPDVPEKSVYRHLTLNLQ